MTEDAFARRFYADRAELDALGIQLRVDKPAEGFSEQENYSLAPEAFHLPAIAFTDEEHAALQTALSLLDGEFAYAEPLRLALQQITWGRPSPLGLAGPARGRRWASPRRPAAPRCPRGWRRSTPRSTAASGSSSSTSRCSRARSRSAASTPTSCSTRRGQFYLVGYSHERDGVRVFRLSRIRGKVAYATKAEHDFQRPADFDPRVYANRIPWQLGDTRGTAEIWVSDRIAWHVERNFGLYGEMAEADDTGRVFRTGYALPRLLISWALGYGEHARIIGPPELAAEAHERLDAIVKRHSGEPFTSLAEGKPPGADDPEAERDADPLAPGGGDPARALRPPRHARLGPDRRRPRGAPPAGRGGHRAAADLRAGAARGHLGPQRRQLRRRRLRALRRGPGQRDRGRHRALLRHLRPPGAAAADRGQRADRGDQLPRRRTCPSISCRRARRSRPRSARSARRGCWSRAPAPTTPTWRATSAARSSRAT